MIQVFLIDRHALVRSGINLILATADDITVCGEAEAADKAPELIARLKPDMFLVHLTDNDEVDQATLNRITELSPDSKILGLSGSVDNQLQASAIRHGASGVFMTYEASRNSIAGYKKSVCRRSMDKQVAGDFAFERCGCVDNGLG